ncbi:MAG: hypothetical protein AUK47_00775 [Deltaproteobacteria bacterium CG2_30_63_29]|nr:MAG: hypothetical protein AUK47_00775 [Deltaproteobacteria bacterium CG2_30_63_29]PJB38018.1 MAG: hypothetical protein CO108_19715 [Deltaproteobacteria bacterium CG_4_9_14_3_um_filter_63_12]
MKRLVTSVILLISFALSGTAVFADDAAVKEKFYNFDDMLIDGEFKTPQGMYENARDKAKFDRLLKLKKSFLPKIQETSQEEALDS